MVAVAHRAQHDQFDQNADDQDDRNHQDDRQQETTGPGQEHRRNIGPQHVERAMRQIDDVHYAEHQRQSGRNQEQKDPELNAV